MSRFIAYTTGRDLLMSQILPLPTETVSIESLYGRILAQDITAKVNVPSFDRSPYDGYAFRSEDTAEASKDHPITLRILEEIPAGSVSHYPVTKGCAAKVLTGAPIPEGANAVIKFEQTEFTAEAVTIFAPCKKDSNIVKTGEDVKTGDILAQALERLDPIGSLL